MEIFDEEDDENDGGDDVNMVMFNAGHPGMGHH